MGEALDEDRAPQEEYVHGGDRSPSCGTSAPVGVPSAKGIRPLGRQCHRPSSNTASLGDEGVKGRLGEDPSREGTPRQDLLAALSFLDAVDTKVAAAERERFEQLRDQVRSADDGHGLPEGLLHGNLLHAPDHAVLSEQGPVAINWKASGRGPRLADFAYLIWGTGSRNPRRPNRERIDAAVSAYRRHVEPTGDELGRLEAVMYIRTLYLACFGYRRALANGSAFKEWGFIEPPGYFTSTAAATRAAFRR